MHATNTGTTLSFFSPPSPTPPPPACPVATFHPGLEKLPPKSKVGRILEARVGQKIEVGRILGARLGSFWSKLGG